MMLMSLAQESVKTVSADAVKMILLIIGILIVGALVRWLVRRLIDQVVTGLSRGSKNLGTTAAALAPLDAQEKEELARRGQRGKTIASVLKSTTTAVVGTVTVLTVLSVLKIPVGPLLASAGIIGVALGFGAQSLVKDVISGLFMLAEDQYGVGDTVDLGAASGKVEAVGLRVTRLRDDDGTIWFVRNGEIERVGNRSHSLSLHPNSSPSPKPDAEAATDREGKHDAG